jgi:hypothetical protein
MKQMAKGPVVRKKLGFTAAIALLVLVVLLSSCEEKAKPKPEPLWLTDNSAAELELPPEQKQLLDKLMMVGAVLSPGPLQRINPQWTALASEFTGKYVDEWKNPEALKRFAQDLDRKDRAALRRLGEYFRLALCGGVLAEDINAGKREALRGMVELLRYEGESRLWSVRQDESGSHLDSPSLRLLETAIPDAGIALPYDWKPASWYERIYEKWLAWWKENHNFLVYDADAWIYTVKTAAKESGKPLNPVSGEEMTPEEIKAYDAVLARVLDWIKNTRLY